MTKSPLTDSEVLTGNKYTGRAYEIRAITPHYMVWNCSGETCAWSFVEPARRASANYCIGNQGDIVLNVPEEDAAWTSSSYDNDNRSITIECANYNETKDGHVYGQLPDATWESLVALCADICSRYGKTGLVFTGEADYYGIPDDKLLVTLHKFFSNTDCPGPWLSEQIDRLVSEVNERLSGSSPAQEETRRQVRYLLSRAQMAAEVMFHLVTHEAHGYSQLAREGDGTWEDITLSDGTVVTIRGGDKDCSEAVRLCYEAAGVLGGYWESYLYTAIEDEVLTNAGFVTVPLDDAQVGDVLWKLGHTELVIEVDGELQQAGFRRSETGGKHGEVGDQDGLESTYSSYNPWEWTTCYRYAGPERYGYGEVTTEENWSGDMEIMYIINVKEDHRINPADDRTAMLKAGWQVFWTQSGGFKYLEHPDSVKLLVDNVKHFTGKDIPQISSSSKAPFAFRLYQCTALNAQNTVLKDRWPHQ